jgi:hypothetical protein
VSGDGVPPLSDEDCEVIAAGGGRFIVRIGCVCAELSLDELMRLRQVLHSVAGRFNAVVWKLTPPDVAH